MTNLLQFTKNVKKSHRQPQWTSRLVCEVRVFFSLFDISGFLFGQLHPKYERTIRLVYPLFFCKPRFSSNTKKNLRGREERCAPCLNSSISITISNYTHVQINFFSALRMTDKSLPKNTEISSWITLYNVVLEEVLVIVSDFSYGELLSRTCKLQLLRILFYQTLDFKHTVQICHGFKRRYPVSSWVVTEMWGSQLSVAEDSSFPRCYVVPTEKKIFTDLSKDRPGLKNPVAEDTKISRNIGNYLLDDNG
jgi:hypothetical protein